MTIYKTTLYNDMRKDKFYIECKPLQMSHETPKLWFCGFVKIHKDKMGHIWMDIKSSKLAKYRKHVYTLNESAGRTILVADFYAMIRKAERIIEKLKEKINDAAEC